MNIGLLILCGILALGLVILLRRGSGGNPGMLEELRKREQQARDEAEGLRKELGEARVSEAKAREEALQTLKHAEEERRLLSEAEAKLKDAFEALASRALLSNSEEMHKRSEAALANSKAQLQQSAETRNAEIKGLVGPLKDQLENIRQFGERLKTDEGALRQELTRLSQETGHLSQTLRSSQGRGRLNESFLERYAEAAGLKKGIHYDTQVQTKGRDEDRIVKPDMIVHLAGKRDIILDGKAVLDAYQSAVNEKDEGKRSAFFEKHLSDLKATINNLASKKYQDQFLTAPDFVVLFLPSDGVLEAALNLEPGLFLEAAEKKVILTTPSGLMALLKVVHRAWSEATMAENAQAIVAQGQVLMDRLIKFQEHLAVVGTKLEESVDAFNSAYGSMKKNLNPAIRDLKELGVVPTKTAKKDLLPKAIESRPRYKDAEAPGTAVPEAARESLGIEEPQQEEML